MLVILMFFAVCWLFCSFAVGIVILRTPKNQRRITKSLRNRALLIVLGPLSVIAFLGLSGLLVLAEADDASNH